MIATRDLNNKNFKIKEGKAIPENVVKLLGGSEYVIKSKLGVKTVEDYQNLKKSEEDKIKADQKKTDEMQKKIVSDREKKRHPVKLDKDKK